MSNNGYSKLVLIEKRDVEIIIFKRRQFVKVSV